MFESVGIFKYDPRKGKVPDKWWAILDVDADLQRYYKYLFEITHKVNLVRPSWAPHISVCRGHEPEHKAAWGRYEGRPFKFRYNPEAIFDDLWKPNEEDGLVWLSIECPELTKVRVELGLWERPSRIGFHLTLGKIRPEDLERVRWKLYRD